MKCLVVKRKKATSLGWSDGARTSPDVGKFVRVVGYLGSPVFIQLVIAILLM